VLLELKGRVELVIPTWLDHLGLSIHDLPLTSPRGVAGGPAAISFAFVPGRIRLFESASPFSLLARPWTAATESANKGDFGPIWTSGNGGGLGRRGELVGDAGSVMFIIFEGECMLERGRTGKLQRVVIPELELGHRL
jgi:hypothetical protein